MPLTSSCATRRSGRASCDSLGFRSSLACAMSWAARWPRRGGLQMSLGAFYKKFLKFVVPVPLRLGATAMSVPLRRKEGLQDPAEELRKAIKGTYFKLSYGSCVGVRFGRCGMPEARRPSVTRLCLRRSWRPTQRR